jgi:hypothetical protein
MPRYNILIGCDQEYYDEWGVNCLESIQKYAPWINLHCHVVNPSELYQIPGVSYTTEEKEFVSDNHKVSYLQCIRFIIAPRVFKSDELVMAIDSDFVCVNTFTEEDFEKIAQRITILQHPKSAKWLAGAVTFGTGDFRKEFVKELYADDDDFWPVGRDQNIIAALSTKYKYETLPKEWINTGKATDTAFFLTLKGGQKVQTNFVEAYGSYIKRSENTDPMYHIHIESRENLQDITNPFFYFDSQIGTEYIKIDNMKRKIEVGPSSGHIVVSGDISLDDTRILSRLEEWTGYEFKSTSIWNGRFTTTVDNPIEYYSVLDKVDLLSFRENYGGSRWVPCVSCMHKIFNRTLEKSTIGLGAVLNGKQKNKSGLKVPTVFDTDNFKNICTLISSCETIITNSFYGAYWSMLFGKRVMIMEGTDPRIHSIPIPYVYTSNRYFNNIKTFSSNVEFLNICRSRNTEFYEKLKLKIGVVDDQ